MRFRDPLHLHSDSSYTAHSLVINHYAKSKKYIKQINEIYFKQISLSFDNICTIFLAIQDTEYCRKYSGSNIDSLVTHSCVYVYVLYIGVCT